MQYAVLTNTLGGYEDCWTVTDENGTRPDRFQTREAAQADIDEVFEEYHHQVRNGYREPDEVPDKDDEYLIVPVSEINQHLSGTA